MPKWALHHLVGLSVFQCKSKYKTLSHWKHHASSGVFSWLRCWPSRRLGSQAFLSLDTVLNGTELQARLTLGCSHLSPKSHRNAEFQWTLTYCLLNLYNLGCATSEWFQSHLFRGRCCMNSTKMTNEGLVLSRSVVPHVVVIPDYKISKVYNCDFLQLWIVM